MKNLDIRLFKEATPELIKLVQTLEETVFEAPLSAVELEREFKSKFGLTILIAYMDEIPCGYKIGYEQSPKRFYSWIGGITPSHRNLGIAKALMMRQHEIAKENGYSFVTTQTKNSFKEMLVLNIKSGF